ncbi:MAG: radical SAM family heme chaperone HemW [Bacteroidia bacterium]
MLYIHIPFCKQACNYCDFHFATSYRYLDVLFDSLLKEIRLRRDEIPQNISSIYLGGGTPSLLKIEQLNKLFDCIHANFFVENNAEITLEANPDDLTKQYLRELKKTSVNRLSIGIQSFYESDLKFMNRAHTKTEAELCTMQAAEAGFNNLSIDLIYSTPGLSNEAWRNNLIKASQLPVNHLSCYSLTVEENTPLFKQINQGKVSAPQEENAATHFEILQQLAPELGFEHYEISNLAKPGYQAKHNSDYWSGKSYLGIGPSAHSFTNRNRRVNIANNNRYIKDLLTGDCQHEDEKIDASTRYNELILTGFRTLKGISIEEILSLGYSYLPYFKEKLKNHPNRDSIKLDASTIRLLPSKWLLADGIASDFFY